MKLTDFQSLIPCAFYEQNPKGRALVTAAYLLQHHGYVCLAKELDELGKELIKMGPSN